MGYVTETTHNPKLKSGLSKVDDLFKTQIRQSRGEIKRELIEIHSLWKKRADIVGRNLALKVAGSYDEAKSLIDVGFFLLSSGTEKKRLEQNIDDVKKNLGGRSENLRFITDEYYRSLTELTKTVQAMKAYLQKPTEENKAELRKALISCSQQAKKTKIAEQYHEKAIEFQVMYQVNIANLKNAILLLNRYMEIASEMAQKGLIPLGEEQKVKASLTDQKKKMEDRIKLLETQLRNFKINVAILNDQGKFSINPHYGVFLQLTENMVKNTVGYSIAVSWQTLLAKEVNDYYTKGYWQRPVSDPALQDSLKRIKLLIDVGKNVLQAEIKSLSKQPSLQSLKEGVLASLGKIEGAIFRGEYPVGIRAIRNMYIENLNADDAIAQANQVPDNRTWWEKHHTTVIDVAMVGVGILGTPLIAGAVAVYFTGRVATDLTGNYLITKKLPGVLELLSAAAMIIVPVAKATRSIIALRRARVLEAEFKYSGIARGSLKFGTEKVLDVERRLAAELALEEAGGLKYLDTVSKVAGNYLTVSAVGSVIYDHSLENLLTNAVFFAMGASHGLAARLRAMKIRRIGPERLRKVTAYSLGQN